MLEAQHLRSEGSGARTLCAGACLRLGIAEQIMVNRKLLKRLEDLEDRILPAAEGPERMVIKFVEMDGSYSADQMEIPRGSSTALPFCANGYGRGTVLRIHRPL